jgi:hypothetical protein
LVGIIRPDASTRKLVAMLLQELDQAGIIGVAQAAAQESVKCGFQSTASDPITLAQTDPGPDSGVEGEWHRASRRATSRLIWEARGRPYRLEGLTPAKQVLQALLLRAA